jgi:hypothetical protein
MGNFLMITQVAQIFGLARQNFWVRATNFMGSRDKIMGSRDKIYGFARHFLARATFFGSRDKIKADPNFYPTLWVIDSSLSDSIVEIMSQFPKKTQLLLPSTTLKGVFT